MNVWLSKYYQGLVSIEDPLLYDTRLTPEGQQQALKLSAKLASGKLLGGIPDLLVVSPLTRALQTTQLAFPDEIQARAGNALPIHLPPLSSLTHNSN